MSKLRYPYLNLSLENEKGEIWRNIPGLEGYYEVSNYGRIKRLEFEMQYKNDAIYLKPEKIIKPGIVKQVNKFKNDFTYFLVNRIVYNKKKYNFTVARLVYQVFVEPLDINDYSINIICHDEDNFNIRPTNLKKVTISLKQQRILKRKRFKSPLLDLSDDARKEIRKSIIKTKSKRVSQYSKDGNLIKIYSSMAEAQRATGVFSTSIASRASGKGKTAGGFIWKWE